MDKVYVILVNYNRWEETLKCLESVLKTKYLHYQAIVVDNDSTNKSIQKIVDWSEGKQDLVLHDESHLIQYIKPSIPKPVHYVIINDSNQIPNRKKFSSDHLSTKLVIIKSNFNRGFSAGNNVGIRYALARGDAKYFWLLNNDTVVSPESLSELVKQANKYENLKKRIGIIGAKLLDYKKPHLIQGVGGVYNKWIGTIKHTGMFEPDRGQYDNESTASKIDYPIGASLFVSKEFIHDVGLMCEDYFLYFEELDWTLRAKRDNWKIGFCWKAKIYHKRGATIGSKENEAQKDEIHDYYAKRNRLLITKKFYPKHQFSVLIVLFMIFLKRIIYRKNKNAKLILKAIKDAYICEI